MKILLFAALLWLPVSVNSQELTNVELDSVPGMSDGQDSGSPEVLQRPDTQRIMSELSTSLRLSSRQEDRIGAAVKKKTSEFDKLMKEYERNSAEEKKWRFKANESRYGMLRINREMPDIVREYLDDEQREAYDAMLEAAQKPAASASSSPKPVRKKVLVKRRKAPAAAVTDEEAGQVMVDKEARPAPRKKKVVRRKVPVRKPQPVRPAAAPAAPPAAEAPAEPPAEEADLGSYP